MELQDLAARASEIRALYAELETRRNGRAWSASDLMAGFVGDVGDLSKLVAAHVGVRPGPPALADALGHELADCLWSVLALSEELGIDLESAFVQTMDSLEQHVRAELGTA